MSENNQFDKDKLSGEKRYPERAAMQPVSVNMKDVYAGPEINQFLCVYAGPVNPQTMMTYAGPDEKMCGFNTDILKNYNVINECDEVDTPKGFCKMCGYQRSNGKFCPECGAKYED